MSAKQQRLDKLKAQIIEDNVCPHLAEKATNLVFGEGNADSNIVFIGEAPGQQEDLQGRPFVGAAGKFLVEMLESIGLKREDVYITNIVKYRPPGNRDPLPDEKADFLPYLVRQLEIIKPKLIVTLGRHPMSLFLPEFSISQAHGQPKRKNGVVYLPLFHPAAALYRGELREVQMNDFAKIPKVLQQLS